MRGFIQWLSVDLDTNIHLPVVGKVIGIIAVLII